MGACRLQIGLKRVQRRNPLYVKAARARIDQVEQRRLGQVKVRNRIEKRGRYRISESVPLTGSFESIAPPLESEPAEQRFRDGFIDPRHFVAERIKGVNMPPPVLPNKKARKPAVLIHAADEILAISVIRAPRGNVRRIWRTLMRQELFWPSCFASRFRPASWHLRQRGPGQPCRRASQGKSASASR